MYLYYVLVFRSNEEHSYYYYLVTLTTALSAAEQCQLHVSHSTPCVNVFLVQRYVL